MIRHLLAFHPQPPLRLEEAWTRSRGTPRGRVVVEREPAPTQGRKTTRLRCRVYFDYGDGLVIEAADSTSIAGWASSHNAIARDTEAEVELLKELFAAGARRVRDSHDLSQISTTKSGLRRMVVELGRRNWIVEAEGKSYRTGGTFSLSVSSGIDWFQVAGTIDFDGHQVALPKILSRIQRGSNLIELGDGSVGVLPDEWLHQVGLLASLGQAQGESWRFARSQGWILNALLSAKPDVTMDRDFEAYRDKLAAFDGIRPQQESKSFQGTLRNYQREALGWLTFLRDFGLGGCLADDMGLGKTIEWLAFLESLRSAKGAKGPHLVIVPRSVVGNWLREAQKFTPKLRVIDCSRAERQDRLQNLQEADIALTTYGTLRRDILLLSDIAFDTIALDEAQAIKNAQSQTAKSAKLLQARQRIALSGTPIENNIGELWSLFDFLNPGMLGNTKRFQTLALTGTRVASDKTALSILATALRPFVLRRTKEQVLTDLPEKVEQTIYCDMGPKQSELYEELKAHYQALLLTRGRNVEVPHPNNMQVLEALLRLRQLACHPRLLDPERGNDESIKLKVLLEHLEDVRSGGHKALVFSQFTKFLALVREALDRADIPFEYLDGKTRNRDAKIDRFQQDPECPVFLISLKAGGLGLNLTAADYVFILDPWWNPATESQAIDRAHRIGQEKRVFAYRLVTKGTVEERILEL
ncbi:MAG: DEAD/DEAH box helicase, partial [Vicinamibacteria bacterium]